MDERHQTALLLIGFGPHSRRIYYPIITNEANDLGMHIACAVDLTSQRPVIESYLTGRGESLPVYYLNVDRPDVLDTSTTELLDRLVGEYHIGGVIIATEPLAHVAYARWALGRNLPILMDKPTSTAVNASTSETQANSIIRDYETLAKDYREAKKRNPRLLFSLMAQRRYHPAFRKMKKLVAEVKARTGCPVTSIQSFHSDGQWRMPSELMDITYHSYNQGYGKCSHTGYHGLDIVPWLLEGAESADTSITEVDIVANVSRPVDFLTQLPLSAYRKIFPDFDSHNRYDEQTLRNQTSSFGEIDAFNSMTFRHGKNVITLGSLNLVHNGFSQRGWLLPNADLYKGNGRVRHETHFIEQGPFQAISFISYQSDQINPKHKHRMFDTGGEYHLDIHVFRNHNLFPDWKRYTKYSIESLNTSVVTGYSRGHQEDARRNAIVEFSESLKGSVHHPASDFLDHKRGTMLFAGVYQSAARRFHGKNPLVTVKY